MKGKERKRKKWKINVLETVKMQQYFFAFIFRSIFIIASSLINFSHNNNNFIGICLCKRMYFACFCCFRSVSIKECATIGSGQLEIQCIKDLSHVERTYTKNKNKEKCDAIDFRKHYNDEAFSKYSIFQYDQKCKLVCVDRI